MPRVYSLSASYSKAVMQIQVLENYRQSSNLLPAQFQHFVAEVILLRLFAIIESSIIEVAHKVACNTPYRNGVIATSLVSCVSISDARNKFTNHGRPQPAKLRWTKVSFVNSSVSNVIPATEPFYLKLQGHGASINDIRIIRNYIAHRNSSSRQDYKSLIKRTFGANLKIQPGAFLISTKRLPRAKVDDYIAGAKVLINDITSG